MGFEEESERDESLEYRRRDKREDFEKRSSLFYANVNPNWPLGLTLSFFEIKMFVSLGFAGKRV